MASPHSAFENTSSKSASDGNQASAQSAQSNHSQGPAPKRTVVMYSRITIWLALLFISSGLAMQSVQLNLFTQADVDSAFANAMAAQMAHTLRVQLQQTQQQQEIASSHANTLRALRQGDEQWLSTLKQFMDGASELYLLNRQQALGLQVRLGYAVQELVSRTLKGHSMKLEAVMRDGEPHFYWASAVRDENQQIQGVLLVEYGARWLSQFQSNTSNKLGLVTVTQFVDSKQKNGLEVFRTGATNHNKPVTVPINNFWFLSFNASDARPQLALLPLATPWILVLVITLISLFTIIWLQKRELKQNQLRLIQFVRALSRKGENDFPRFSLKLFHDLANSMEHLLNTSHPQVQTAQGQATQDYGDNGRTPRERQDVSLQQPGKRTTSASTQPSSSSASAAGDALVVEDMQPVKPPKMPRQIFRAYDIRGIIGDDLDDDISYWIGRALAAELRQRQQTKIALAWDGRLSSPALANALQQGLIEGGVHVVRLGAQPTGLLYYASHELDTPNGIVVTGSHNPADFNGFKIVINQQTLAQQELLALYHRINRNDLGSNDVPEGEVEERQLAPVYLQRICDDVQISRDLKVVIDAGNGIAGPLAKELMASLNIQATALYCDVDGHFPNHHPDPSIDGNLVALQQAVIKQQADLGLAFDGDGDRVALVDNNGEIVRADRSLMLLLQDILPRNPGKDALYDVKSSRHLAPLISRLGGRPGMWKTGHSLMKQRMRETGAVIGGEFSGHFYIQDRWYGFDDGLYTAARLLEVISQDTRPLDQLCAELAEDISTPEITLDSSEERKFTIISALQADQQLIADARVFDIDGLRLEYDDGWCLVRASNTSAKLTLRFAGNDDAAIARMQQHMKAALLRHAPEVRVSF